MRRGSKSSLRLKGFAAIVAVSQNISAGSVQSQRDRTTPGQFLISKMNSL